MIILIRCIWIFYLGTSIYALLSGKAINPFHLYNIIQYLLIIVGISTSWFRNISTLTICGIAGVLVSLMTSFQIYSLLSLFRDFGDFQSYIGPIALTGKSAYIVFLLPAVHFISSSMLLIKQIQLVDFETIHQMQHDPYDYEHYTYYELVDVEKHINKEEYPERYNELQIEIKKRKAKKINKL